MERLVNLKHQVVGVLDPAGDWVALLPIRLLMAYEFGKAGLMKFNGNNWFANYQDNFLFPFNYVPVEISWFMATWTEILGVSVSRSPSGSTSFRSFSSTDTRNASSTYS